MTITRGTDYGVYMYGPVDEAANAAIEPAAYPNIVVNFRVFDDKKDHTIGVAETVLRSDVAAGADSGFEIPHMEPAIFHIPAVVYMTLDDGSEQFLGAINAFDAGNDESFPETNFTTIGTASQTDYKASAGNRIRIGGPVAFETFVVEDTHSPLESGDIVITRTAEGVENDTAGVDIGNAEARITMDGKVLNDHPTLTYVTLNAVQTSVEGRQVSCLLLDDTAQTIWPSTGPYKVGFADWGWRGIYPDAETLKRFKGDRVRIEKTMSGVAGLALVENEIHDVE